MKEPNSEKIGYLEKTVKVSDKIKVECKTEIDTSEISSVICVSNWQDIKTQMIKEGKIEYSGKAVFFICYEDSEGVLKKCECTAEFNKELVSDKIVKGEKVKLSLNSEKTEIDTTTIKLTLYGYIETVATIYTQKEITYISGGEDLIKENSDYTLYKSSGVKQIIFPVEDEFTLPYEIQEVLFQRADSVITNVMCGVGSIIADGEVYLSAILLQSGEKNSIIRENKVLSFRAEIECEDAMPSLSATCECLTRSLKTDITVDEKGSKVSASITVKLEGEAFTEQNITPIKDAFCQLENIELNKQKADYPDKTQMNLQKQRCEGTCNLTEISENSVLVSVLNERAQVVSYECNENKIEVSVVVNFVALFRNSEQKIYSRKCETPIIVTLDNPYYNSDGANFNQNKKPEFELNACVQNGTAKILSNEQLSFECEMIFTCTYYSYSSFEFVSDIKVISEKECDNCAISVYIPKENEDLWSLSKRLNVSPEQLVETNKDLQFPLSGNERIVVYRQK